MIEEEILNRLHNLEHKIEIILHKLRLSELADEGDHEAAVLAKAPPSLPQEQRPPCPVCNQPIQIIQLTPSQMFNKDGTSFFGYKRICGCKITSTRI